MGARVVLAYSGGLDTSVAVRWMGEEWGCEVIALAVDVGQGGDFETIRKRALSAGAIEAEVIDARARYADRLRRSGRAGQRPLRGPLPVGVGAVPADHRRGTSWPPPASRRHRRGPRLHRQGQRPGPLRGLHPGAGARSRRAWPRPATGTSTARRRWTTPPSTASPSSRPRRARTRSTRTSGAGPSSAAPSRTPGSRPPDDIWTLTRPPEGGPPDAVGGRDRLRGRVPSRSTAPPCPPTS